MADTETSGGRVSGPQRRQLAVALLCVLAVLAAAFLAPALSGVGGSGGGNGDDPGSGGLPDGSDSNADDGDGGVDLPLDWLFPWSDGGDGPGVPVDRGPVNCVVELGSEPVPGTDVSVRVRRNGQPVADRPVRFNGRQVGRTNERGVVSGRVPYERRLRVTVGLESGGRCRFLGSTSDRPAQGSLSGLVASAADNDSARSYAVAQASGPANSTGNYTVEGTVTVDVRGRLVPGRTVTVRAAVEEVPMRNATVTLDGERVGSTDERGRHSLTVPERERARVMVSRGDFSGGTGLDVEYLQLQVVPLEGLPFPGEPAVVNASINGHPAVGKTVRTDGTSRGTTDGRGLFRFGLPADPRTGVAVSALEQRRTRSLWTVYAPTLGGLAAIVVLGTVTTGAARRTGRRRLARRFGVSWAWLAGGFLAVVVAELQGGLLALGVGVVALVGYFRRELGAAGESSASALARLARGVWRACRRVAAVLERTVVRGRELLGRVGSWLGTVPRSVSGLLGRLVPWLRSRPGRVGAAVASVGPARLAAAALGLTVVAASTAFAGELGLAVSVLVVLVAAGTWWVLTREDATDGDDRTDGTADRTVRRRGTTRESTPEGEPTLRELWRRFARRVAPATWRVRTPGEVSRTAIEDGYPPEPVRTLARAFRDVEYGGRPPETRHERASEAFDALARVERSERTDGVGTDRREDES